MIPYMSCCALVISFDVTLVTLWTCSCDSSVGEESACNAGAPSSIPGSGRSAGIPYALQYSWAFLVAQLVKNPPAMWETWVRFLGLEDALEPGKATHSQYSGLENSVDCIGDGVAKSQTLLSDFHFHFKI